MTTKTEQPWLFQCISGEHVGAIKPGTELEKKATERGAKGYIGAITLGYNECPWCIDNKRDRQNQNWRMLGCPNWDHENKCDCTPTPIPDSPYEGQVTGIHNT